MDALVAPPQSQQDDISEPSLIAWLTDNWRQITLTFWLFTALVMVSMRWAMIRWFVLPDTDDNMRMMQVRGLLHGQRWFDLRQYALNPPYGANMHWSRLVDLPLAGLMLLFKPLGTGVAEQIAAAIAPLLPLSVAMFAMSIVVRRLISPFAYPLALLLMLCCVAAMPLFMPMRIDHHGWQLACVVLTMAGIADDRRSRGGILIGLASAASLTIGLEMIAFLAIAGGAIVLRWVADATEAQRLRSYALSFGVGCAGGYFGFQSYDNARLMCDVLSPVWLSVMVAASILALAMAFIPARTMALRLGLAAASGALIAGGFVYFWPDCLGRPEHVSPEVADIWLNNVREARPLFSQNALTAWGTTALPIAGLIGTLVALWQARSTPKFAVWAMLAIFMITGFGLLLWQVRMAWATQLIAVPGATALAWLLVPRIQRSSHMLVRVFGTVAVALAVSGLGVSYAALQITDHPNQATTRTDKLSASANRCATIPSMLPLNRLPTTTIFTHVDLSPRLITLTHQHAIAGPYHRNGAEILDVYHVFGGSAAQARAIMAKHGATLLLICPHLSETTVYQSRWPHGFYTQLVTGHVPDWLTPLALPAKSPFKLWAIQPMTTGARRDDSQT